MVRGEIGFLVPLTVAGRRPHLMHHGHSEPVHQRASVLAEARLAWNESSPSWAHDPPTPPGGR